MAMTYQNFASLGVNLNRQKYGPLDISSVFTSEADLKYYLSKGTYTEGVSTYWYKNANEKIVPYPYEGQVIATVINDDVKVYVLRLDAEGAFEAKAIEPEVDGKTVKLTNGKLELVGLPTDTSKVYVPSLVNGVLTWAEPDTSTAEGQQQAIEGLTASVAGLSEVINGKGEGEERVVGLVEKVAALEAVDNATQAELDAYKEVVSGAIAEALQAAKDYADQNDANTVYDDTELAGRVKAIEDDYLKEEDKYDDSELKGRVDVIERDYLKKSDETIYDDSELVERIESLEETVEAIDFVDSDELAGALAPYAKSEDVNAELAKKADKEAFEELKGTVEAFLTGDGTEAALDSLKELIEYINTHDDVEISGILSSIEAIEGKLEGVESTVVAYVTAAIEALKIGDYAKAADLTDLAGRVEVLENKPFDTYATKSEVEAVDGKFSNYTTTSDLNNLLAVKANASDVVSNEVFGQFQTSNSEAIEAAKSSVVSEIEGKGYAVATEVESTYATKSSVTEAVEGIENSLLTYAKSEDVNKELAKKIETGSIAHSSESLVEGVTVEGTKLNIVVDAYTKEETRNYVADVIRDMTGGESAADVLRDLNAHIDTYTEKVGQIDAKDAAQDLLITAAKTQADKGVEDAAKVAADLVTANGLITDNAREIGVVKGSISTVNETLTGKITALEGKDTVIEGNITALQTTVGGHTTTITEHGIAIKALQGEDTRLATLIQGNTDKFADYYTKGEVDAAIEVVSEAVGKIDLSPYAKVEDVNAEFETLNSSLTEAINTKANITDVYSKSEADETFVKGADFESLVDNRVNALIDGANSEDTIANVINLVNYVNDNADNIAQLVSDVENNGKAIAQNVIDIAANKAAHEKNAGDIVTLTATVAAQKVVESSEISVSAVDNGVELGIKEISTDKLVQGSEVLVLNGGSAI